MEHFANLRLNRPYPHAARIELDNASATYAAGQPISGRLHIMAGDGPPPRSVSVELQNAGSGRHGSVSVAAEQPLPNGPWAPGHSYSYPFSLIAAPLPPPFAGELFQSHTRVAAVLDMPDHHHPAVKPLSRAFPAAIQLVSIHVPGPIMLRDLDAARVLGPGAIHLGTGGALLLALGFVLFGLVVGGVGVVLTFLFNVLLGVVIGVVAMVFVVIGGLVATRHFGNWRAERILGTPHWSIESRRHMQGASLYVSAEAAGRMDRVGLEVCVEEHISGPTGPEGNTWSRSRDVAMLRYELAPQQPGRWAIDIPTAQFDNLPLPQRLVDNHIFWAAHLVIETRGRTWRKQKELGVFRGEDWEPRYRFSFD